MKSEEFEQHRIHHRSTLRNLRSHQNDGIQMEKIWNAVYKEKSNEHTL